MALSGVPLFFSGAWTKEEILHATADWPPSHVPYYLMLLGVVLTALYMTRQMIYVFFGQARDASEHAHESPRVMTLPLIVLAFCTIAFSVVLTPAWPWLYFYLQGELNVTPASLIQPMLFVSLALVVVGVGLALVIYRNVGLRDRAIEIDPLADAQPVLFRFLERKMWIDEFYERTVILWSRMLSRFSDWMDRFVWDGLVRGIRCVWDSFSESSQTGSTNRGSTPVSMKRLSAPAVSDV